MRDGAVSAEGPLPGLGTESAAPHRLRRPVPPAGPNPDTLVAQSPRPPPATSAEAGRRGPLVLFGAGSSASRVGHSLAAAWRLFGPQSCDSADRRPRGADDVRQPDPPSRSGASGPWPSGSRSAPRGGHAVLFQELGWQFRESGRVSAAGALPRAPHGPQKSRGLRGGFGAGGRRGQETSRPCWCLDRKARPWGQVEGTDRQTDRLPASYLCSGWGGPAATTPAPVLAASGRGPAPRGRGLVYLILLCRVPRSDFLQAPESPSLPPQSCRTLARSTRAPGLGRDLPGPAAPLEAPANRGQIAISCFFSWQGVFTGPPDTSLPAGLQGPSSCPRPPPAHTLPAGRGHPSPRGLWVLFRGRGRGRHQRGALTLTAAHTLHFFSFDATKKNPNV